MTTEQKFFKLERTNRHWRWLAGALGLVLVAIVGVGAAQEAPKELVLEKLTIKSDKGEAKIILFSTGDGAAIVVADANKNSRIGVSILPNGLASVSHFDVNGKVRITVGTSDGEDNEASISHFDANGKNRIAAHTYASGLASVDHYDANEKRRVTVSTNADGIASIAHFDAKGKNRIAARTYTSGLASIAHFDAKGKERIITATDPNSTASTVYQNYNANGKLKIVRSLP